MRVEHDPSAPAAARVDVCIPAYRRAMYVCDAIESVISQTFPAWHLTIFDNGPGGGAVHEAVEQYLSHPQISYAPSGSELTLADNWTRAIQHGHAEYVGLLPDDDRWHPEFLEARVVALNAHPACAFAFAESLETDEQGVVLTRPPYAFPKGVLSRHVLADCFTLKNPVAPSAIIVRRSAYDAVGARFDGSWHYCDWEMWARLAARFPAYYLTQHDSEFRRQPSANTFTTFESPDRLLMMVTQIEERFLTEVEGFELSRLVRARSRSRILLHAAADVLSVGGWRASGALYRRALRVYPPMAMSRVSATMLARTALGTRGRRLVARLRRRDGQHNHAGSQS